MQSPAHESSPSEPRVGPGPVEAAWRYRWLVVAVTVLAALAAYGLSFLQSPMYEAQARLLLTDPAAAGLFEEDSGESERLVANQTEVANSPDVYARAAELLGGGYSEADVAARVEARGSEEVDLLTIVGEDESPRQAAALTNAVADAYQQLRAEDANDRAERSIEQLSESMARLRERIADAEQALVGNPEDPSTEAERDAAVEQLAAFETRADEIAVDAALFGSGVERVSEARPPSEPSEPRPRRNAAVGLVLGMMAGTGLAWWRADHVRAAAGSQDPAAVLRAPLLAKVPDFKSVGVTALDPARSAPDSAAAESYHFLMSALEYALAGVSGRSVLVTSAGPDVGKTLTALNLSIAAARDGRRALLCDADERTRGLTALTGAAPTPGLTDLADEAIPIDGAVALIDVPATPGLPLVAAGTRPVDSAAFFRSAGFRTAIRRLKQHRDLLIIDSPPILAVSDTSAIASQVDGIVVVVAKGTPLKTLEEARRRLDFIGTPLLGYVFNRADGRRGSYHAYGLEEDRYAANGTPQAEERVRAAANGRHVLRSGEPSEAGWRES